jgi:hypothetical protein
MIYRLLGNFDIVFSGMDGTRTPSNGSLFSMHFREIELVSSIVTETTPAESSSTVKC